MATWRERLRPASFRGVPFYVDSSQFTGGRRVVLHEFPDRDNGFPEDMGLITRAWKIEGYVLGAEYMENRDDLLLALEMFGDGELVHPYYGILSVQSGAYSVDEVKDEGGYAKFSFQFYKSNDKRYPQAADNKRALLQDLAVAAQDAAKGDFDKLFSVAKLPGFAVATARASVLNAALYFQKATRGVVTTIEGIANLAYGIRNLRAEVNDLVQSPGKLSSRLLDSLDLLAGAIDLPRDQFKAFSGAFAFGKSDAAVRGDTPTRVRERDNKAAFDIFIQRVTVANAVSAAIDIPFESVQEASTVRSQLADLIDDILLDADDDTVFNTFKDLGAQLIAVLPDTNESLPNLKTVVLIDTTPSLVLAYDLFGDPDLESDIVARNRIANPAFIVGGTELEVLDVG